MKTILTYTLLAVLTLGLGCKRSPVGEAVDPNPPQPPANCRILRETYKVLSLGWEAKDIVDPETITLDDKEKVQVSTVTKTTYKYDEQGRVIESFGQNLSTYYVERFIYSGTYLLHYTEYTAVGNNIPTIIRDTIPLNEQGLVTRRRGLGAPYLLYNTEKQPIGELYDRGKSYVYENGNLIQVFQNGTWAERNGQFGPTDYKLRRFNYNLDRPNLPVVQQFRGQLSRNLPITEVWEMQGSSQFRDRAVYRKTYTYTYDKLGRVKRRVVNGVPIRQGWMTEDDPYGIGVTDYEYECP